MAQKKKPATPKSASRKPKNASAKKSPPSPAPAPVEPLVEIEPTAQANRGRPPLHSEPWSKITVVLLNRNVGYLDRMAIDIRLKTGKAISRAEIIRALIEAAFQSGLDFSGCASPEAIVELLLA